MENFIIQKAISIGYNGDVYDLEDIVTWVNDNYHICISVYNEDSIWKGNIHHYSTYNDYIIHVCDDIEELTFKTYKEAMVYLLMYTIYYIEDTKLYHRLAIL